MELVTCSACSGTGQQGCSNCNCSGYVEHDGKNYPCAYCNGAGYKTCVYCNGAGRKYI